MYMMLSNFGSLEGIIDCILRQQYFKLYKSVGSLLTYTNLYFILFQDPDGMGMKYNCD